MLTPKNKTGGGVASTIFGVGALLIAVIVLLVITSTLLGAGLFDDDRSSTTNLDQLVTDANDTATFGNNTLQGAECSLTTINNATTYESYGLDNYTVTNPGCSIKFTGSDQSINNSQLRINSSTTYYGISEQSTRDLNTNFTGGIDNVSEKVPTILLIVAVVFLFGALVLLIRNSRAMGIGSGGSL
jgi:hypothetical protein